ncbi:MAG: hypothetical protein KAT14_00720, partial [Candidatus Marinimicrobia bacterium]|nr:hypothetical protein [Candidatus Neomarinimicrobiota bacterium]
MYCSLAFPSDIYQTFTYRVPDEIQDALQPGMRVKAPFGPRAQVGYCIKCFPVLPAKSGYTIKSINSILDDKR